MSRGISLPDSAAAMASCGEQGTPTTGFRGCQSPTDNFFDPVSCQSPMDRFFEGPQVPVFFGPGGQSCPAQPSGCMVIQGVAPQGMASAGAAAAIAPMGPVGFGAWSGAGVGPQVYLCPAGAIGPNGVQMAALPAPVAVPAQAGGMTMPVQMAATVPSGLPMALPAGAVAGPVPGMAAEVAAPGVAQAVAQPAPPMMQQPPSRREPASEPLPPVPAADSIDLAKRSSPENRPPCPTAIYVDLTCLREKTH